MNKSFQIAILLMFIVLMFIVVINAKINRRNIIETNKISCLKYNQRQSYLNSYYFIDDFSVYYGGDTAMVFNFSEILSGQCLVLRFSGNWCNACNEFAINKLKEHFPDYESNNRIILLCDNLNARIENGYYGKKTFSYCSDDYHLPLEADYVPFFFMVDSTRTSNMVFIPEKSSPEFTDEYLKIVKSRFFTSSSHFLR